jgi:hypothetical protein
MDDPQATDNVLDQTDQELLTFSVSDEALEKPRAAQAGCKPIPRRALGRSASEKLWLQPTEERTSINFLTNSCNIDRNPPRLI